MQQYVNRKEKTMREDFLARLNSLKQEVWNSLPSTYAFRKMQRMFTIVINNEVSMNAAANYFPIPEDPFPRGWVVAFNSRMSVYSDETLIAIMKHEITHLFYEDWRQSFIEQLRETTEERLAKEMRADLAFTTREDRRSIFEFLMVFNRYGEVLPEWHQVRLQQLEPRGEDNVYESSCMWREKL